MTVHDGNAAGGSAGREPHTDESQETDGRSVGNLELFFDLTFVYAMSQVTHLMLSDISWQGFGRGVLALLALWWAWVCYAWLTNLFEVARVVHTTLIILAMAAMPIAVIALPTAFTTGALVFGLALLAVRLINAGMFIASSSQGEAEFASAIRRLMPGLLVGPALIVAAAFVASPYRELMWVAAAAVDFGSPLIARISELRVVPSYFVARHGSVIIIALGETIVELGAGATQDLHHPRVLGAVVLGVLISASLWWTYFGLTVGAELRMQRTSAVDRPRLARDAYTYLHLPPPCVFGAVVLGVLISASLWWTYFGLTVGAELRMQRTSAVDRPRLARDAYTYLHLPPPCVFGAVVLGVLISASLWWTYFGLTVGAELRMQRTSAVDRPRLARDAYSYLHLHLPLVAGIIFFAVGARVSIEHIGEPLAPLPALALTGGVALFYA